MLNTTFYIGKGDTQDPLRATLYAEDGVTPLDLTGCTILFEMVSELGTMLLDDVAASIDGVDPKLGKVRYDWSAGDTDKVGVHRARFKVVREGQTFSAPNEGHIDVHVTGL